MTIETAELYQIEVYANWIAFSCYTLPSTTETKPASLKTKSFATLRGQHISIGRQEWIMCATVKIAL